VLNEIKNILRITPGLKGREMAKKLKIDRKKVNLFLSKGHDGLFQDADNWKWYLKSSDVIEFNLTCKSWLTCEGFEENYKEVGNLLDADESNVLIKFPQGFKVLLIAGARIIALINQLILKDKKVVLNFEDCKKSMGYLSRLGFFDHIHEGIEIVPFRPKTSRAKQYKGNSKNIVEIGNIDLSDFNENLPKELTAAFIHHAGNDYRMASFTVFSELIGNVDEHSETPIPGFAALQLYNGKQKHIQTVISDHGLGLSKTLKENLKDHYPELADSLDMDSVDSDLDLIQKALTDGKLSRFGHNPEDVARGLGLKRSQDYALKYNAEITVRQDDFSIKMIYQDGELVDSIRSKDLEFLAGTHVCFDFILD
jgi:hypothetical protein